MNRLSSFRSMRMAIVLVVILCAVGMQACRNESDNNSDNDALPTDSRLLSLDLDLPDSITGGQMATRQDCGVQRAAGAGSGMPCAYMGPDDDDPFRNGYEMTKFMVSAVAAWTCFADTLIEVADGVAHDGIIHETDNDYSQPDYDPDDPTHYQISDASETQTTIRFYYGYDRQSPPQVGQDPQFFLSWNQSPAGGIEGRLIIDGESIGSEDREPEDPEVMRMDFNYDDLLEVVDVFLRFDENNAWAEGLRIKVTKDLTAGPLEQVFTALGLIEMKAQFLSVDDIAEVPTVHMFTVSDDFGNGAALAEFQQLAIALELNPDLDNHLGNYLFDKDDIYFFEEDMDWDWVQKSITDARYRGSRTTPADGGVWIPFDPSLDMIASELGLGTDYFTGSQCVDIDDNCTDLLNAVFEDGFADQEPNQGSDPGDWRSDAIAMPTYLETVYPNGADWDGAFDYEFTP